MWKQEVNILLCTHTKTHISYHLHSYKRSLFIDLPLQFDKNQVKLQNHQALALWLCTNIPARGLLLQTEPTVPVNNLQKEGILTVRSSVGFAFNLSGFVTFLFLLINQILNYREELDNKRQITRCWWNDDSSQINWLKEWWFCSRGRSASSQ